MRQRDWIEYRVKHPTGLDVVSQELVDTIMEHAQKLGPAETIERDGKLDSIIRRSRGRARYKKRAQRLGWHAVSGKAAQDPEA